MINVSVGSVRGKLKTAVGTFFAFFTIFPKNDQVMSGLSHDYFMNQLKHKAGASGFAHHVIF